VVALVVEPAQLGGDLLHRRKAALPRQSIHGGRLIDRPIQTAQRPPVGPISARPRPADLPLDTVMRPPVTA
jgi:hypothetical protein